MKRILLLTAWLISCNLAFGDSKDSVGTKEFIRKFYTSNSMDGAILSSAAIKHAGATSTGTIRFSYFFNAGTSFNFNFGKSVGAFTGIDIKNIGFIEKNSGVTVKRRTYNVGVPVGIKFGDMGRKGSYVFLGGGVDAPINYKEKAFTSRSHKSKFNEWFSDRTPVFMPYLFAGVKIRTGMNLKLQYYLGNFLNPDFKDNNGHAVYTGYDVHLFMLSLGYIAPGRNGRHKKVSTK